MQGKQVGKALNQVRQRALLLRLVQQHVREPVIGLRILYNYCRVKACEAGRRTRLLCGGPITLTDPGATMCSGVSRG
ncbi:hypothetical protein ABZ471_43780 [Streptomyces sp. NPDC005728]|uniref:hypothetical protein n=1 Tax=Streptomyces sp. NPDC005728 TaxID=3157054 RepID=UPI0033CFAADD